MAGILGSYKVLSAGTYEVYSTPASTYTKCIINVTSEATAIANVKIYVHTGVAADKDVIQYENLTPNNNGVVRTQIVLTAGQKVSVYSDQAGVTCSVMGNEYPSNSKEASSNQLISSNGEYVLYTCPTGSVSTINSSFSKVGNVGSSSVKLYVSQSNASNGVIIYSGNVGIDSNGFEFSGISLKAGDKIIAVFSNLTGTLATTSYGIWRNQ